MGIYSDVPTKSKQLFIAPLCRRQNNGLLFALFALSTVLDNVAPLRRRQNNGLFFALFAHG